jgi:hypothetical protein
MQKSVQQTPVPPPHSAPMWMHLIPALVLNSVIALGITVFGDHGYGTNWVYSQCIGLSIGMLIHQASHRLITDWPTQWRWLALIVPVGALVGMLLGNALADLLLGNDSSAYWVTQPRKALGFLTLSLVAGAAITYYFVSRGQIAQERTNAEAALRQAAESRLRLLESQLEPHMLFNTLANLRALIGVDPGRAQTMLDHLVDYLRATLSASRTDTASQTHTLQDEFSRLGDYLELMAVRMGPRLHYTLDLPDELRGQTLPPLLLQPLVENSIQHGLEPKVDGGSITVSARCDGETLTLLVADTGLGFDTTTPTNSNAAPQRGFGLAQVRERLATVYGNTFAIDLVAAHAGGIRASITFPCQK